MGVNAQVKSSICKTQSTIRSVAWIILSINERELWRKTIFDEEVRSSVWDLCTLKYLLGIKMKSSVDRRVYNSGLRNRDRE